MVLTIYHMDMEVIIMVMESLSMENLASMENSASMENLARDGSDAEANILNMQL